MTLIEVVKMFKQATFNSIQDGVGAKKVPHTSFSPAASTNVGIIPKNFLTFSF